MTLERQVSIDFYENRLNFKVVERLRTQARAVVNEGTGESYEDAYCNLLVCAYTNYLRKLEGRR
jgi:hypothetical protein